MRWFFAAPLLATAVGCATIPDRSPAPASSGDASFARRTMAQQPPPAPPPANVVRTSDGVAEGVPALDRR
ncbi:MAG: hypothetical protein ACXVDD_11495 [Polyangia bacterium]